MGPVGRCRAPGRGGGVGEGAEQEVVVTGAPGEGPAEGRGVADGEVDQAGPGVEAGGLGGAGDDGLANEVGPRGITVDAGGGIYLGPKQDG
ncbi:hypothetical protein [Streptomyces sp. NPDC007856]|uniref:hypothetical protein n=1 Tax=Streptomyces sp. NPDC007856 TaxID=3364781 RepID=UPI00367A9985